VQVSHVERGHRVGRRDPSSLGSWGGTGSHHALLSRESSRGVAEGLLRREGLAQLLIRLCDCCHSSGDFFLKSDSV
jgi:hypothetical protein